MADFDPNLPADHSPIVAAELRNQFNNLNTQIGTLPAGPDVDNAIRDQAAKNVDALTPLAQSISSPPTQAQVQALQDKLNALITALRWS